MAVNLVSSVNPILSPSIKGVTGAGQTESTEQVNFGDVLKAALNNLESMQNDATKLSNDFVAGKIDNIQQVTIAGTKAELALQFTVQVRNKILDAYSEIMRMQI